MVEIRYGDQYEVTDLAGQTVSEAREQFKAEFGIPDKAKAKLNSSKVKSGAEIDTVLNDDDRLTFAVSRSRMPYMVGALLLALAITGGVFAFGFINASVTINATVKESNFADVTANIDGVSSINSWTTYGFYKGVVPVNTTNGTPIFNVNTSASGYAGDLVVSVSLGNADRLVKFYRALSLQLVLCDSANRTIDINEDNSGTNNSTDWVMLTLENGAVSMFPNGVSNGDNMTVRIKRGFFITHVHPRLGWPLPSGANNAAVDLFCEVAQR
jgi:hypothetical protein